MTGREKIMKKTTKDTVLVLRTCSANMTSHVDFKWPKRGPVSAPDWIDNYECGHGLHGWLWGEGDGTLGHVDTPKAKWLVVRVLASEIRHGAGHLIGKCKFPRGYVVHCGDRKSATEYIMRHGASGKAVIGSTVTAGDYGTATAGDYGTATAGDYGTATAGYKGTICIKYYDVQKDRYRIAIAYVGENGIMPNRKYKLNDSHEFVEVE